jgi:hypothetical protein
MVKELRRRHPAGLRATSIAVLAAGGFALANGLIDSTGKDQVLMCILGAAGIAIGGGLWALQVYVLGPRYNPNAAFPNRPPIRAGEPLAVRTAAYQQRLDESAHAAAGSAPQASAQGWHVMNQAGQTHGPMSREELLSLLRQQGILLTDSVWAAGMEQWVPAAEVFGAEVEGGKG